MSADPFPDEQAFDLSAAVKLVLSNWLHELKALFAPLLFNSAPELVIAAGPQALDLYRVHSGARDLLGTITRDSDNHRADIRELRSQTDRAGIGHDVVLSLPSEALLRPHVKMPKAGEAALRGALAYEIERLSPVPPAELYYDHLVVGLDNEMLEIELRMVRRPLLDELIATAHASGLLIGAIRFDDDARAADGRRFPVDRYAALRASLGRFRRIGMLVFALIMAIGLLFATYARQAAELTAAVDASAEAGMRAARVEKLQHTIAQVSKDITYAAEQKRSPMFVGVLADLTQVLPDGTWVTELTFDRTTIRIVGASTSATDLIGLIDRSPRFRYARFEAPLLHDQSTNTDRFDLSFQLRGK